MLILFLARFSLFWKDVSHRSWNPLLKECIEILDMCSWHEFIYSLLIQFVGDFASCGLFKERLEELQKVRYGTRCRV